MIASNKERYYIERRMRKPKRHELMWSWYLYFYRSTAIKYDWNNYNHDRI